MLFDLGPGPGMASVQRRRRGRRERTRIRPYRRVRVSEPGLPDREVEVEVFAVSYGGEDLDEPDHETTPPAPTLPTPPAEREVDQAISEMLSEVAPVIFSRDHQPPVCTTTGDLVGEREEWLASLLLSHPAPLHPAIRR